MVVTSLSLHDDHVLGSVLLYFFLHHVDFCELDRVSLLYLLYHTYSFYLHVSLDLSRSWKLLSYIAFAFRH